MESVTTPRELPPLILHPFDKRLDRDAASESSDLDPFIPPHLQQRYAEFRMLCLIGKDLDRWLSQCVDLASRESALAGFSESNFILLLLFSPPLTFLHKMRSWSIKNYQIIFSRAIGLNAVFPHPPAARDLSEAFLLKFHKYADALYDARLNSEYSANTLEDRFTFEVYASGEYASSLAKSWGEWTGGSLV